MWLDQDLLERFEAGLNPQQVDRSSVPAVIIGYGEISAIFQIDGDSSIAYKRLPLFSSRQAAQGYAGLYDEYCHLLQQAGLHLPESATAAVETPGRPVVLYVGQRAFPARQFCHRLIHDLPTEQVRLLLQRIMVQQKMIRSFNETIRPRLEIAVDGQLSNWVVDGDLGTGTIYFIDTSTPFIRRQGRHQLDTALLLRSVPVFMRWLTRRLLADDILDRYFDPRKNLIDLAANLFKEQRPDLIPTAVAVINENLPDNTRLLSGKEIAAYYRMDRHVWSLFLTLRRLDRLITTRLLRRRYEFILPGDIKR